MNVLAIDGALGGFSVAISRDDKIETATQEHGNVALERGLSAIGLALARARIAAEELDRLAVGIGPGGFTGLRIAIAYAKSLASVWKRPLVPLSSFDLLEFGQSFDCVLTVVVGRPGVISARYRRAGTIVRASGWVADVLNEVMPVAPSDGTLSVVGAPKDVLHALAERGVVVHPVNPLVTPAAAAAALAAGSHAPASSVHAVVADYGELPAARIPKR